MVQPTGTHSCHLLENVNQCGKKTQVNEAREVEVVKHATHGKKQTFNIYGVAG